MDTLNTTSNRNSSAKDIYLPTEKENVQIYYDYLNKRRNEFRRN